MKIRKGNIIKISFTILTVTLLGVLYGYYNITNKYNLLEDEYSTENRLLQNQFDEILKKYDSLNYIVEEEEAKEIKKVLKEALKDSKEFNSNASKMNLNGKKNDTQINNLKVEISESSNAIIELNKKIIKNKELLNHLESVNKYGTSSKLKHDKLSAVNINARGVKILSDLYSRPSKRPIQQIRVCFTLEGNEFINYGHKDIFIQIVNPKNQIISVANTSVELDEVKLLYSAKTETLYNQKDIDVCAYVDLESKKTIKGKYTINIYNSFSKIGSSIFEYE